MLEAIAVYRQGEFGYLELLTAQRTYFRTNLEYLLALGNLWTSSVRIEGDAAFRCAGTIDLNVVAGL